MLQYPVLTITESAPNRYISPYASSYQTPRGTNVNGEDSPSDSSRGDQSDAADRKGKKRAKSTSKNAASGEEEHHPKGPVEIAYASLLTADQHIREDDFEVSPRDTSHMPQLANKEPEQSPISEESGQWGTQDDSEDRNKTHGYGFGAAEDGDVWGK